MLTMSRLRPEDISKELTEEKIILLANMAMKFPVTEEWREIAKLLSVEQRILVNNKISELKRMEEEQRQASLSEEEKAEEAAKWERIKNDPDPHKFYGNMGQPETPQEFKNRYGVWPPGYDENGNKLP